MAATTVNHSDPHVTIAGYSLTLHSSQSLRDEIRRRATLGRKTMLFFANTNFVVQCRKLRAALTHRDVLIVNDGVGMDLAAYLTGHHTFRENLNGTDFVPYLLTDWPGKPRVFLYGGAPAVAAQAASKLSSRGVNIVGCIDGYRDDPATVDAAIDFAAPDIVLVALGNPMQENWILEHADAASPRVYIGVGALFDFLSGRARRAPTWVRRLRLEWFYRLCHEPRRLARRYTVDILLFFSLCLRG